MYTVFINKIFSVYIKYEITFFRSAIFSNILVTQGTLYFRGERESIGNTLLKK